MWEFIEKVIIHPQARSSEEAIRIQRYAREHKIPTLIQDQNPEELKTAPDKGAQQSKQSVLVIPHVGAALKPCTGRTDSLLCCNLSVVTQTVGCPLDCSYCILQSYQNTKMIIVHSDYFSILDQISLQLNLQPRRLFRICTGQVADSLALEPVIGFAEKAVKRFASFQNAVLELKTKTEGVDFLLGLPHRGRTIISWSLNPEKAVAREEHRSAPLANRLRAAARVAGSGYLVAFHLDPMVTQSGNPAPFCDLIKQLADCVPAEQVAYISMGTVRFQPHMRRTVLSRFPESQITNAEFLPDIDGKLRMLAPRRIELYQAVSREVRECFPDTFLYLCMEPPRIWRRGLGLHFNHRREVEVAFARSLHRRFGLAPCDPDPVDYPD